MTAIERSSLDMDRRTVFDGGVDLFDLRIRDGDAAISPVHERMEAAGPYQSLADAMNHDHAARFGVAGMRLSRVVSGWIGDVQRTVKSAPRVVIVDYVIAFRGASVAEQLLWPDGMRTE